MYLYNTGTAKEERFYAEKLLHRRWCIGYDCRDQYGRNGAEVTVLEQNDRPGKKILSTGNGRCNLTNLQITEKCYRGDDQTFIRPVLSRFQIDDALALFKSLGIITKCRGDYVYPLNDQASAVRDALELEAKQAGVKIINSVSVDQIKKKQHFQIHCKENKNIYTADRVILACGSKKSQISGSDGSGYTLAKMLGHTFLQWYLHSWRFVPMKNILRNWPESELVSHRAVIG